MSALALRLLEAALTAFVLKVLDDIWLWSFSRAWSAREASFEPQTLAGKQLGFACEPELSCDCVRLR
jgi:hypothetical protein